MKRIGWCCSGRLAPSALLPILAPILLLPPGRALAQAPPPAERATIYSAYEEETITDVLARLHRERDPSPEGKTIERVDIVPLRVFERRDLVPGLVMWANVFHATSRQYVIRRELLLNEGDQYQQVLVDDTIRNLRRLPQLSAVLVVPTVGSAPDRVGVVVITKDVWSLRLGWNISLTPGGVELFEMAPAEWNFLGTHQTLSGHFVYLPESYTFGLGYSVPRLGTSRVALTAAVDVIVNQASGKPEGWAGSVVAGQPIYSGLTEWAWDESVVWQDSPLRRYVNARLSRYLDPATGLTIPFEYRARQYSTVHEVTRSFGWDVKHDITFGATIEKNQFLVQTPGADPQTVRDFIAKYVPHSDTRVGPSILYHSYTKRYVRMIDFDTLALQEDHALGHNVVLSVFPSFHALGSTRDVVSLYEGLQYTFAVRDGLFRASFESTTEPEPTRIADAAIQPTAHFVSPSILKLGRIVLDGTMVYRWRNYLNQSATLGGGDRLRGYPTNFFVGKQLVTYNVELRSRPVEILSCQIAGVGFFDAGDAFTGWSDFAAYQSVGVGLRALFPWLDKVVFRADLGFPIERPLDPVAGAPIAPLAFFISFGQAFLTPTVSPTPVLPTGQ
jgi:hypothetical protein